MDEKSYMISINRSSKVISSKYQKQISIKKVRNYKKHLL